MARVALARRLAVVLAALQLKMALKQKAERHPRMDARSLEDIDPA